MKALVISNFYFQENVAQDMLSGVQKLQYINIDNIKGDTDQILSLDIFSNNENLIVCQDQQLIQTNYDLCCDIEIGSAQTKCLPSSNFIILHYSSSTLLSICNTLSLIS